MRAATAALFGDKMKKLDETSIELLYDMYRDSMSDHEIIQRYNGHAEKMMRELEDVGYIKNISRTHGRMYTLTREAKKMLEGMAVARFGLKF